MLKCIFIFKPRECSTCLDSAILQCLLDKPYLRVRKAAKKELIALLVKDIESQGRFK